MIILKNKDDLSLLIPFPAEVKNEAIRVMTILYENYTKNNFDGGYIAIIESLDDVSSLSFDIRTSIYEFIDHISEDYVSILYLVGTEYAVTVIMPTSLTKEILKGGINL